MQQSLSPCMLLYLKCRSNVDEKRKKKKEEKIGFCKQHSDWLVNLIVYLCILSLFYWLCNATVAFQFLAFFLHLCYFTCAPFSVIIFLSALLLVETELQIIYINTSAQS